jgi:hypothetical protein
MKNLKLLVLLCAVLFVNAASAQWLLTGNTLTGTSFLGSNNNFDIIVKRNGVQSGLLNTASSNTSWGVSALNPSTTGTLNTALGSTALTANTTGYNNIAIGSGALTTNTSGYQNVGVGTGALAVSNGQANVAIGSYSLVANTSGPNNTGVGYQSLGANTTGQQSVGLGYQALLGNTTGSNNVGVGYHTLTVNTTGSNNMALGYNANVGSSALTNATAIGAGAVANLSNSIVLGNGSVNVGIGNSSPNASALLDLTSSTQGLLPPRIALTATNSASPLAANVAGMILYNTATAGTSPNNVTPGYYYNNGSAWVRLTDASSPGPWVASSIGTNNIINTNTGGVIIGTGITSTPLGYNLYVSGGILTEKVKAALTSGTQWSDYVFNKDYKLQPLDSVANYINTNKHLPDVPSADELVKNGGVDMATMFALQMKKIEELTLYMIEMKKEVESLKKENARLHSKHLVVSCKKA